MSASVFSEISFINSRGVWPAVFLAVTPVSNLEVGDIINWIGIYDAGTEVHFDTITLLKYDRAIPFEVVDIDYNPNKPDDIIFEFDKVLVPTNSKVITINKDRLAGTNIKNTN